MKYQSNAQWPKLIPGSITDDSVSTDIHDTWEQAHNVCEALRLEGLGGEGKIFPVRTWVSKVENSDD